MEKNNFKIIGIVIGVLILACGIAVGMYFSTREENPEDSIIVTISGEKKVINLHKLSLTKFEGSIINGKGETIEVEAEGVRVADIIGTTDFKEASVIADDEYSATIKPEDLKKAWLQVEGGSARLIVFGDTTAKRDVKNVVRIEVK